MFKAAKWSTPTPTENLLREKLTSVGNVEHRLAWERDGWEILVKETKSRAKYQINQIRQVENLCEHIVSSGLLERVELVVISPLLSPPILALEVARDRNGVCMRRNVSEYQSLFPTIDFSQIESEEDNLWRPDVRESEEEALARGLEFMKWLWKRPEKEVAVVSHGIVLQHMFLTSSTEK
ncbi:unnamed protein product [Thlaspi arvense]|uniref:Phosphoglycerate mutase n=1 Tax=Thlaspi arvense TaxID=13288 RepID=A0AAU9R7B3_THLAR|nr:unnamed protein product [Thlaspi arvense]